MLLIGIIGLLFVTFLVYLLLAIVGDKKEIISDTHKYTKTEPTEQEEVKSTTYNRTIPDKGTIGEQKVAKVLFELDTDYYVVFNNLLFDVNGSTVQIDHVVVSIYGIFVIETKNYKGVISGAEDDEDWQYSIYGNKYTFRNPILQNQAHIGAIKYVLKKSELPILPIVAFVGDCTFNLSVRNYPIVTLDDLYECVAQYNGVCLCAEDAKFIAERLWAANISSPEAEAKHKEEVKRKQEDSAAAIRTGVCPRCGANLKRITEGYNTYYRCEKYPDCSFTNR